jgi:hypothetical protein
VKNLRPEKFSYRTAFFDQVHPARRASLDSPPAFAAPALAIKTDAARQKASARSESFSRGVRKEKLEGREASPLLDGFPREARKGKPKRGEVALQSA